MNYIVAHSTLKTNLVSFWEMQEDSGTRYDSHGANHLTANGTGGVATAVGKVNDCADFERGDSDYLSISDASQSGLDLTTNASFSFWVKIETLPSAGQIFSLINKMTTASNESYNLFLQNSAGTYLLCLQASGDGTYGGAGTFWNVTWTTPVAGTWYHLVFTYAGASNRTTWYLNGTQLAQSTTDYTEGSFYSGSSAFMIGGDPGWNNGYWDGLIDSVGVWSKELTSSEVTDLYDSGTGMAYGIAYDVSEQDTLSPTSAGTSKSATVNVGSNTDRILWVSLMDGDNTTDITTSLTYNGVAMTKLAGRRLNTSTQYISLWYLKNPTSGSNTLQWTGSSNATFVYAVSAVYIGFPSASGIVGTATDNADDASAPQTLTLTTEADYSWLISTVRSTDTGDHSAGTGTTERQQLANSLGDSNGAKATAGSYSMTWDTIPTANKIGGVMGHFYVPSSSPNVTVSPSVLTATFTIPAYTTTQQLNPQVVSATFSIPTYTVTDQRNVSTSVGILTGTFTIPAYALQADFWEDKFVASGTTWSDKF